MSLTTDPNDPRLNRDRDNSKPGPQNEVYLVLSEEERAKGFVRPVRCIYRHVGDRPKFPLRELTAEELERHGQFGYVAFEAYPESYRPVTGRFWTQAQLDYKACGTTTTMGRALSETYARDPKFYGATYCCCCKTHRPVAEFIWEVDGSVVGS